ncbi:MAG: peptidase carboxypeptidase [Gemmatimonadetes bacterium]|nr:peptidase carboxypeptidase [Gemmatimonadota bacterium]
MRSRSLIAPFILVMSLVGQPVSAQGRKITTPKQAFGFNLGDDYRLANYTQLEKYWKTLAIESDRLKLVDIGLTAEGRHQYMAVITSPANQKKLDHYRGISKRLAMAEGLTDDQARALAKEGKTVIFMDGGLHSTETVGHQALMELAFQMVSRNDEETMRFLDDDILLLCLANPDGMELVSNWYMREADSSKRTMNIPRLYQKYVGHDNARDLFMSNQPETININKVLFTDWLPQITHTHHQTGPAGAVVFMPPFRDPFNYGFDPLVITELDLVGAAMHSRLIAKGMPGSAMKAAANYSTWFNGAMRTVSYFHNIVGLLTEIIGSPTPMEVPLVLERQLPSGNGPMPVAPQVWHFRRSIDYDMEYSRAVLDVASRYRETFLYNIYQMGKNSIERGNTDSWTVTPKRIAAAESAAAKLPAMRSGGGGDGGGRGATIVPTEIYAGVLHDPKMRDARGYVIPSDQADFATATKFVNVLLKNGITVLRATSPFQVAGKRYPASSYVVKTAQAPRAFVVDMFEPQDHPNDFKYPGGPPNPPYDVTGWTPAFSMGIQFDRYQNAFDGPFTKVTSLQSMPVASVRGVGSPAGYLVSHRINNSFILVNRLLKSNATVFMVKEPTTADGEDLGTGALWVPATPAVKAIVDRGARELGVPIHAVSSAPRSETTQLRQARIGVYDQYGGNIPSGWTKWLFEQFEYPYEIVYPQTLDAGNLNAKFDVLVFPDGSARLSADGGRRGGAAQPTPESLPAEFRGWLGSISSEKTIPQLKRFAEAGGTIIALGSSTSMGEILGLPVKNYLVEKDASGVERPLTQEKYYIPGSLLKMNIAKGGPLSYGMPDQVDVVFSNSPVFRLAPDAASKGTTSVASFDSPDLVSSGWAWGRDYVRGGTAVVNAKVGKGTVVLLGPEVAFRGQTHSTFKLLFNGLYDYGTPTPIP